MSIHKMPQAPIQELREAVKKAKVGEGWVLVKFPSDGPIAVEAYSDMTLGDVLASLQLGVQIVGSNILYEEPDGDAG